MIKTAPGASRRAQAGSALIAVPDPLGRQAPARSWRVEALVLESLAGTIDMSAPAAGRAAARGWIAPGDLRGCTGRLPQPWPGQTTLITVQEARGPAHGSALIAADG